MLSVLFMCIVHLFHSFSFFFLLEVINYNFPHFFLFSFSIVLFVFLFVLLDSILHFKCYCRMCGDTLCSFIFKTGTLKTRCKHFVQGQNFLIGGQHCTTMRPNTRICSSYRLYWIVFPEVPIIIFLRRAGGMVDVMLGACIISWEPSGGSKLGLFPLKIQNLAESLHFQTNGPSISSAVLVSLSPELQ